MALLKLTTLTMSIGDRWELLFFRQIVVKNGELVSKTIKKEEYQLCQATFTQGRQDLWAKIDSMENFGIAARGLALTVDLLVNPSILTNGGIIEWFLGTACIYEEFDAELHAQVFKDGITLCCTRIRAYLEGTEENTPPRITTIPEEIAQRIVHLKEATRHNVKPFIIPDEGA